MVAFLAPLVEELLFRGFLHRAFPRAAAEQAPTALTTRCGVECGVASDANAGVVGAESRYGIRPQVPERTTMISTTSRLGRRGRRPAEQTGAAVALRDGRKVHGRGDGAVVALDGVSAALERGSLTAIMG